MPRTTTRYTYLTVRSATRLYFYLVGFVARETRQDFAEVARRSGHRQEGVHEIEMSPATQSLACNTIYGFVFGGHRLGFRC